MGTTTATAIVPWVLRPECAVLFDPLGRVWVPVVEEETDEDVEDGVMLRGNWVDVVIVVTTPPLPSVGVTVTADDEGGGVVEEGGGVVVDSDVEGGSELEEEEKDDEGNEDVEVEDSELVVGGSVGAEVLLLVELVGSVVVEF